MQLTSDTHMAVPVQFCTGWAINRRPMSGVYYLVGTVWMNGKVIWTASESIGQNKPEWFTEDSKAEAKARAYEALRLGIPGMH